MSFSTKRCSFWWCLHDWHAQGQGNRHRDWLLRFCCSMLCLAMGSREMEGQQHRWHGLRAEAGKEDSWVPYQHTTRPQGTRIILAKLTQHCTCTSELVSEARGGPAGFGGSGSQKSTTVDSGRAWYRVTGGEKPHGRHSATCAHSLSQTSVTGHDKDETSSVLTQSVCFHMLVMQFSWAYCDAHNTSCYDLCTERLKYPQTIQRWLQFEISAIFVL